jgi:putative glycosyltransferase (TIGR04348 family)
MPRSLATPLRVIIATPAPRGSRHGNRATALRWAAMLRHLGARVKVVDRWNGQVCDLLVAVHAVKTAASVADASAALPDLRVVVLLAGTDVYPSFRPDAAAAAALARADAIVALQHRAADVLPAALRHKVHTILQSATAVRAERPVDRVRCCVLAHLRPVKDPLLPADALAALPRELPLELHLAGKAMTPELEEHVHAAAARDPRFRWLGELPRREAKRLLASSHFCIVPSSAEGGANVVSEAIAAGTPLIASAVPGNLGLLGDDWPALFPAGDTAALGVLLRRALDRDFRELLLARTRALQPLVDPQSEFGAWRELLANLGVG